MDKYLMINKSNITWTLNIARRKLEACISASLMYALKSLTLRFQLIEWLRTSWRSIKCDRWEKGSKGESPFFCQFHFSLYSSFLIHPSIHPSLKTVWFSQTYLCSTVPQQSIPTKVFTSHQGMRRPPTKKMFGAWEEEVLFTDHLPKNLSLGGWAEMFQEHIAISCILVLGHPLLVVVRFGSTSVVPLVQHFTFPTGMDGNYSGVGKKVKLWISPLPAYGNHGTKAALICIASSCVLLPWHVTAGLGDLGPRNQMQCSRLLYLVLRWIVILWIISSLLSLKLWYTSGETRICLTRL